MKSWEGNSSRWFWIFWLVIALHIAVYYAPTPPGYLPRVTPIPDAIEVSPMAPDSREKKPIVRTEKSEEDNNEKARFGGEFRNRVKKETQSPNTGTFKPGGSSAPGAPAPSKAGDLPLRMSDLMPDESASPNKLPGDVLRGDRTMLNTDKVIYASFMNRMVEEMYPTWQRMFHELLAEPRVRKKLSPTVYQVTIEITMDRDGNITEIAIAKGCGIYDLDDALRRAFWETQPFPHPPVQMFEGRSRVSFNFNGFYDITNSGIRIAPLNI